MAIVLDQSTLFGFVFFAGYTGQASGSQNSLDTTDSLISQSLIPAAILAPVDTTINVSFGYNTYYKMQGWNPALQVYEDWHSMGTPLLDPPSGHALENIGIIGTWIDR